MRIGDALAGWLADRPGRLAAQAATGAFARTWAKETPIAAFAEALDAMDAPGADAVAALAEPLIAEPGWAIALVGRLLAEMARDPMFEPPLPPVRSSLHHGLGLYVGRHAVIALGHAPLDRIAAKKAGAGGAIVFTGQRMMLRILRAGGATLSFWDGGCVDGRPLPRCRPVGRRRLEDGAIVTLGEGQSFVIDHAEGDLLWLGATILAGAASLRCDYDARTRRLIGVGAASETASRRQLLTSLLSAIGAADPDAFAVASHAPEPHVRWHAMREWLAADRDAAAPRLRVMAAADPDAELRTLATRILALVG